MKLLNGLLELLYPTRCMFCHKFTRGRAEIICDKCLRSLPCVPLAAQKQRFSHVSACVSPLYYEGLVRQSLLRYKFGGLSFYAEHYADFVAKCIDENKIICDSITWVPLSRRRLRKRGYDQARLLAEAIAVKSGIPCVRMLEKWRNNPPQSRTDKASERRENVAGVYRCVNNAQVEGKRILLIDDIVTTGSTLSECAGVLRRAGAADVTAATVARVR